MNLKTQMSLDSILNVSLQLWPLQNDNERALNKMPSILRQFVLTIIRQHTTKTFGYLSTVLRSD